jgi:hypothetical protein
MCAALELNSRVIRPGRRLPVWRGKGLPAQLVWAGFARKETFGWWKKNGWEPVDVPAEKFAERSDRTRQLAWDAVPAGIVVRGIVETNAARPILKIVTRASTEEEMRRFEHPRMPLMEAPLFSAEPLPVEDGGDAAQAELF